MALDQNKGVWKSAKGKGRRTPKGRQFEDESLSEVKSLLAHRPRQKDLLIEFLHLIQDKYGYLSAQHLCALAEELKLSMADFDKVILESKQTNNQKIYHEALYNKSLLKLLCGEFEEGSKLYENRFYIDQHEEFERFKRKIHADLCRS